MRHIHLLCVGCQGTHAIQAKNPLVIVCRLCHTVTLYHPVAIDMATRWKAIAETVHRRFGDRYEPRHLTAYHYGQLVSVWHPDEAQALHTAHGVIDLAMVPHTWPAEDARLLWRTRRAY